ncbi:MAG: DUF1801 domain-containing protein [Halobacteriota archaeon]|nr:DUF1801 domain-containing protein [Halobacteriota archaeon]
MTELKTKPNEGDVLDFLNGVVDEKRRKDCFVILDLMKEVTGEEPIMWGDSIVGFGSYHYKYKSGREGDWLSTGFSPRKRYLTIYIMSGFERYDELMNKLGKYKTGKSCLYINKIEDIDQSVLKELIRESIEYVARTNS